MHVHSSNMPGNKLFVQVLHQRNERQDDNCEGGAKEGRNSKKERLSTASLPHGNNILPADGRMKNNVSLNAAKTGNFEHQVHRVTMPLQAGRLPRCDTIDMVSGSGIIDESHGASKGKKKTAQ